MAQVIKRKAKEIDLVSSNNDTSNSDELTTNKRSKISSSGSSNENVGTTPVKNKKYISSSLVIEKIPSKKDDEEILNALRKKYPFKINSPQKGKPIRIYSDGIFDLFHLGHAEALKKAKTYFSDVYLLVGVCNDHDTHQKKGKTVMNEEERAQSLIHCRWVDEVIVNAPWVVTQEFIDQYDIHYVAHDAEPYPSGDCDDIYGFIKSQGKFLPVTRTEGISTSDLITRIIKDYDEFLERNLERGISPRDLGLGYLREYLMKKSISKVTSNIHQNWHGTKEELKNDLAELKNDLAQVFASMFNGEGVIDKFLRLRKPRRTLSNGSGTNTEEDEPMANRNDHSASDEDNQDNNTRRSASPVRR
ncbi:8341_t:CDS:2, partial [Entrophospora sp. SA101]